MTPAMMGKVSDILAASPSSSDSDDAGTDCDYNSAAEGFLSADETSAAAAAAAAYAQDHNIKKPMRANLRVDIKVNH